MESYLVDVSSYRPLILTAVYYFSPPLSERKYCAAGRHAVTLCVCPSSRLYYVLTAHRISLGGEGNALYPVLSIVTSLFLVHANYFSFELTSAPRL